MTHGIQIGINAASAVELVTCHRVSSEVYRLREVFSESQNINANINRTRLSKEINYTPNCYGVSLCLHGCSVIIYSIRRVLFFRDIKAIFEKMSAVVIMVYRHNS